MTLWLIYPQSILFNMSRLGHIFVYMPTQIILSKPYRSKQDEHSIPVSCWYDSYVAWHGMAIMVARLKAEDLMKASSLQWMDNCQSIWAPRGILDCHQYSMPLIPNVSDGINTQCHRHLLHPCHICISIIVSVIITLSSVKVDVDEKAKKFDDDCKVHRPSSKVCFQSSSSKFQGLEMSSKFTSLSLEVRTSIQSNLTFVR